MAPTAGLSDLVVWQKINTSVTLLWLLSSTKFLAFDSLLDQSMRWEATKPTPYNSFYRWLTVFIFPTFDGISTVTFGIHGPGNGQRCGCGFFPDTDPNMGSCYCMLFLDHHLHHHRTCTQSPHQGLYDLCVLSLHCRRDFPLSCFFLIVGWFFFFFRPVSVSQDRAEKVSQSSSQQGQGR